MTFNENNVQMTRGDNTKKWNRGQLYAQVIVNSNIDQSKHNRAGGDI